MYLKKRVPNHAISGGGGKIFSIKNGVKHRMDTQMVSFDSPTLREHFEYLV